MYLGFPDSSAGKQSTCNTGDSGSIPRSGKSSSEGIGYPLQYSWASQVVQMIKNLPAMRETWIQSLCWERSLGGGRDNSLQYSCLENPHGQRSLAGCSPWGRKESDTIALLSTVCIKHQARSYIEIITTAFKKIIIKRKKYKHTCSVLLYVLNISYGCIREDIKILDVAWFLIRTPLSSFPHL